MSQQAKHYDLYKPSNVDHLGEIPGHWSVIPLKGRCRIVNGSTPKSDIEAYWTGVIPWVTPADLSNLTTPYVESGGRTISLLGYQSCGTQLVPAGSVILSSRAPIGTVAIAAQEMCTNQGCKSLVVEPNLHSTFLFYVLSISSDILNILGRGTTFLEISSNELGRFQFACPEQEEQIQIAKFLDYETAKIDALIEKQQQLIELLQEKRQAVISHAVTKGLNPDAPMRDSGVEWLGKVPAHWAIKQIRHVTDQLGGGTPAKDNESFWNGNIPWVSPKDMKVDYISDAQDKITQAAVTHSATKLIPVGSILIVVRGMILDHSVPIALTSKPVTINQDMKALVPCKELDSEFLLLALNGLRDYLLSHTDSSAHGTKCLATERLVRTSIVLPSLDEQRDLVGRLKSTIARIDLLSESANEVSKLLQERRTALISAAVTGKIDVRGWKPPESENKTEVA